MLFFENKLLYTAISPVPEEEYVVPIGVAEVKRALVLCDWATVVRSAVKTGRLVVAEPGPLTHGFSAEVIAHMAGVALGVLKAPPRRVAGADVPIPYNRTLENAALPDVEDILSAVRAVPGG